MIWAIYYKSLTWFKTIFWRIPLRLAVRLRCGAQCAPGEEDSLTKPPLFPLFLQCFKGSAILADRPLNLKLENCSLQSSSNSKSRGWGYLERLVSSHRSISRYLCDGIVTGKQYVQGNSFSCSVWIWCRWPYWKNFSCTIRNTIRNTTAFKAHPGWSSVWNLSAHSTLTCENEYTLLLTICFIQAFFRSVTKSFVFFSSLKIEIWSGRLINESSTMTKLEQKTCSHSFKNAMIGGQWAIVKSSTCCFCSNNDFSLSTFCPWGNFPSFNSAKWNSFSLVNSAEISFDVNHLFETSAKRK